MIVWKTTIESAQDKVSLEFQGGKGVRNPIAIHVLSGANTNRLICNHSSYWVATAIATSEKLADHKLLLGTYEKGHCQDLSSAQQKHLVKYQGY